MTDSSEAGNRLRAILVLVATIGTVGFNALAAAGLVNGVRPEDISNKYLTPVTPAGYAFSIWSMIYLGLSAFSIYQILPRNWSKFSRIRTLYIATCLLNIAWIYFWHRDAIAVCFILILLLAVTLYLINSALRDTSNTTEYWLVRVPFGIYFGWVTAATLVNFAVMLAYLGIQLSVTAWTWTAVVLILAASALGVWIRARQSNYMHPLAIAWALTAIAIKQSGNTLIVVACAVGVVACLIAAFSFVVNLPSRPTAEPASK
jgi:hypothetical protein